MSVLPRYESALGRASEKRPSSYVVRVRRLLTPDPSVPVTLGRRETFDDALAEEYMRRVDAVGLRSTAAGAFEAFADVAAYDDVLLTLCRSATASGTASTHSGRARSRATTPSTSLAPTATSAWIPRGDDDGTLVAFADADGDLGAFLDEIARFVGRRGAGCEE